jgi:hypothetical protein
MPVGKYTKEGKKKQASYQAAYRERLKEKGLKAVTIFVPIEPDLNQIDFIGSDDPRILSIKQAIDSVRDNPKFYKISNKDLVAFVQQLEEILR